MRSKRMEYCLDSTAPVVRECPACIDRYMKLTEDLHEKLATAIRWLQRIEKEYPGSINPDAIEKHLLT